jgi:hypothetical protein
MVIYLMFTICISIAFNLNRVALMLYLAHRKRAVVQHSILPENNTYAKGTIRNDRAWYHGPQPGTQHGRP